MVCTISANWKGIVMDEETNRTKPQPSFSPGMDLSTLSLDELHDAIAVYEGEISRLKLEIATKQKGRAAADAFFKS